MSKLQPGEVEEQPSADAALAAADDDCACAMFAVVNPDGTLARGFGAVSSSRISTGAYEVAFRRDVTRCAYIATIGLSGSAGVSTPGEITVVGRFGNAKAVYVDTNDSAGNAADRGFHLAVHCRGN